MPLPTGYDPEDPVDVAALKAEVANDPIGMGYSQFIDSSTKKFMELLNLGEKNVESPVPTTAVTLTAKVLFDNMVSSEFADNPSPANDGDRMWLHQILSFIHDAPNESIEEYKDRIIAMAPNNSATEANIDALIRDLSRAQVLFGNDTFITDLQWAAARSS